MERGSLRPVPLRIDGPVDPAAAHRHVAAALPELGDDMRRALALVEIARRSRADAAAELGVEREALAELLYRGRKALRRSIFPLSATGWCERAERLLSDRLDGALEPPGPARLEVHLRHCDRCADHERGLARARDGLVRGFLDAQSAEPEPEPAPPPAELRVVELEEEAAAEPEAAEPEQVAPAEEAAREPEAAEPERVAPAEEEAAAEPEAAEPEQVAPAEEEAAGPDEVVPDEEAAAAPEQVAPAEEGEAAAPDEIVPDQQAAAEPESVEPPLVSEPAAAEAAGPLAAASAARATRAPAILAQGSFVWGTLVTMAIVLAVASAALTVLAVTGAIERVF